MNLQIIKKQYIGNCDNKKNIVTFDLNGKRFDIDIVYLNLGKDNKFNCFIIGSLYNRVYDYIYMIILILHGMNLQIILCINYINIVGV